MPYDPHKRHRRSIRLKGYDYTQPGVYFITICTQGRVCLFGEIVSGVSPVCTPRVILNNAGRVVQTALEQLPQRFPTIEMDAFVVMPNHVHALVVLTDAQINVDSVGATLVVALSGISEQRAPTRGAPTGRKPALGDVVGAFKSLTTNAYIQGVCDMGWPAFAHRLWQRDYYEHIVRNEEELRAIREYIANNPTGWDSDPDNIRNSA